MGKAVLIVLVGSIIVANGVMLTLSNQQNSAAEATVDYYSAQQAKNIANSMANMLMSNLADSMAWRVENPAALNLFKGSVNYRIVDSAFTVNDTLVKISVAANFLGSTRSVEVFVPRASGGWVPPFIRAAWTANGDLNNTISDMYIDGRNRDMFGVIIPGTGVYGVSSSTVFNNVDNAEIGGTADSVDYAMSYPENPAVIEENYNWGGTFPQSPDEVLGYPEGTLKSVAQSGVNGSQYVTSTKDLTFPLSGVTFFEITDGKEYKLEIEETGNSGILVVHAPGASSRIKQLKLKEKNEVFVGLIITDYSFHHHLDILGAIIQLSPNLETSKNCNGNKDHFVYFCAEAIVNATEIVAKATGLAGNNTGNYNNGTSGSGFGWGRLQAVHWWE